MTVFDELAHWVEKKPLVLLCLDERVSEALYDSRAGFEKFTFAQPHATFDNIKLPTICMVEIKSQEGPQCYIAVIKSKSPITTFESRATVKKLRKISVSSFESLSNMIPAKKFKNEFTTKCPTTGAVALLTPQLSSHIIEILTTDPTNHGALETVSFSLPGLRQMRDSEWSQNNAIETAIAAFALRNDAILELVEVRKNASTMLNNIGEPRVLEDNVITCDAGYLPGFSLIEKDLTGRAVFTRKGERLEVYTANKGPLEKMLGVDLIYINDTLGNIIMIQYKMLEEEHQGGDKGSDWVFRPDKQVETEISRMNLLMPELTTEDYRLNKNPFYFKFVKRKVKGNSPQSFLMSLEHLNQFRQSPAAKGPKGGIRISYDTLHGTYLRASDIISLIRSGYIGTHRSESKLLKPIISQVSKGNKALVLAWQKRIQQEMNKT